MDPLNTRADVCVNPNARAPNSNKMPPWIEYHSKDHLDQATLRGPIRSIDDAKLQIVVRLSLGPSAGRKDPNVMKRRFVRIVMTVVATVALTIIAFVFCITTALGAPASQPNLEFAMLEGTFWGFLGGTLISFWSGSAHQYRLWQICSLIMIWTAAASFLFFAWIAGAASC